MKFLECSRNSFLKPHLFIESGIFPDYGRTLMPLLFQVRRLQRPAY